MVERESFVLGGSEQGITRDPGYSNANDGDGGSGELGAVNFGRSDSGSDDGGDDFTFDPERHIGRDRTNADGSYRRKRRRKDGSTGPSARRNNPQKGATYSASIDALSNTLIIFHAGLASLTKTKELEIESNESEALAKNIANVMAEFDITPDPKIQAVLGLVMTAGMIYGPRMYLIRERVKNEKPKKPNLVSINGTEVNPKDIM